MQLKSISIFCNIKTCHTQSEIDREKLSKKKRERECVREIMANRIYFACGQRNREREKNRKNPSYELGLKIEFLCPALKSISVMQLNLFD